MFETWWKKYYSVIKVLIERYAQSHLRGLGYYLSFSVSLLLASLILINLMQYLEVNHVFVDHQVLATPLFLIGLLFSLYLALSASVIVSREYDKGTLEMLMYGPIDEGAFLFGVFLSHLSLFITGIAGVFIWSNLIVWLFNLSFNINLFLFLIVIILLAVEIIGFGVFSAIWGGKTRNAVVLFVLVLFFISIIPIGDTFITSFIQTSGSATNDPVLFLRDVFRFLNQVTKWISPYSQFLAANMAFVNRIWWEFILINLIMLFEGMLFLFFSIKLLELKGVRSIK